MGTCADAYFFKDQKEYKKFTKNYNLGIKQAVKWNGCYGGALSDVLFQNGYRVEPDLISVLIPKEEVQLLKSNYMKGSIEHEELNRLCEGFKTYKGAKVVYIGYFCDDLLIKE